MSLQGKVVVITGSTYGIGRTIARACGSAGASIVVSSRRQESVDSTVAELVSSGITASGTACDVRDEDALQALLDHTIEAFGRVDVWINNAGVSGGMKALDDMSAQEIRDVVDTNLTGTMLACRMIVPYFAKHGGVILNLAGRGSRGDAAPFGAPYASTKAAITNLTKSIAKENEGRRISIHEILPGMVRTGFYEEMDVSDELADVAHNVEVVLQAIAVPDDVVGAVAVQVCEQEPGLKTGRSYSTFKGWRKLTGTAKIAWSGMTGKMKPMKRSDPS